MRVGQPLGRIYILSEFQAVMYEYVAMFGQSHFEEQYMWK